MILCTDQYDIYYDIDGYDAIDGHAAINHSENYVVGNAHTNSCENRHSFLCNWLRRFRVSPNTSCRATSISSAWCSIPTTGSNKSSGPILHMSLSRIGTSPSYSARTLSITRHFGRLIGCRSQSCRSQITRHNPLGSVTRNFSGIRWCTRHVTSFLPNFLESAVRTRDQPYQSLTPAGHGRSGTSPCGP